MSEAKTRIDVLAEAILALTYTELMDVSLSLADATNGNQFNSDLPGEWASVLAAWAENALQNAVDAE